MENTALLSARAQFTTERLRRIAVIGGSCAPTAFDSMAIVLRSTMRCGGRAVKRLRKAPSSITRACH
jgi:hypothetical protein